MSQLYATEAVMAKKKFVKNRILTKGTTRKPIGKRARRPRTRVIEREVIVKRYVVRLSPDERERLDAMVHKGKGSAWHLLKALILLKADISDAGEAWSDSRIVEALNTNPSMVYLVRKELVEEGFDAVFTRKKRDMPPVPKIFDGEKEAKLIALTCSKPPAGYARWSLRLLEGQVVERGIVDAASDNTIGRVLKKTFSSPTTESSGSFRPKRMRRS
jgi:Homeodomain-like domain